MLQSVNIDGATKGIGQDVVGSRIVIKGSGLFVEISARCILMRSETLRRTQSTSDGVRESRQFRGQFLKERTMLARCAGRMLGGSVRLGS